MSDKEISSIVVNKDKYQQLVDDHEYLKKQFESVVKDKCTLLRENNELSRERGFLKQQLETLTASLKSINSLVEILTETEKE